MILCFMKINILDLQTEQHQRFITLLFQKLTNPLATSMCDYEQQNNIRLRQIRKRQWKLHAQQKTKFDLVFKNNPAPNFLEKQHYPLIAYGIPTEFRNYLWPQLIPNNYNITPSLYLQLVQRLFYFRSMETKKYKLYAGGLQNCIHSQEKINVKQQQINDCNREKNGPNPEAKDNKIQNYLKIIEQDIQRTFPEMKIFRQDTEEHSKLSNILGCFAIFNEDIGYIQGLSTIAALLLQQLSTEYRAFTALTSLIMTVSIYQFYTFDEAGIASFCKQVQLKVRQRDEELCELILSFQIDFKMFIFEWMLTLFTRSFQIDSILNIWDILLLNNLTSRILQQLCSAIVLVRRPLIYRCEQSSQIMKLLKSTKLSSHEQELIFTSMRTLPQNASN